MSVVSRIIKATVESGVIKLSDPDAALKNRKYVSRIIKDAMEAGMIKLEDENAAPKLRRYVPYWT